MKSSLSVLFLIYLFTFAGCKCKSDTEFCPGISPELSNLIRYAPNDSIIFRNDDGESVKFQVTTSFKSEDSEVDCNDASYSCNCDPCVTYANYKSVTQDSIWSYYDSTGAYHDFRKLEYQVNPSTPATAILNFQIANLYYTVPYPNQGLENDQLHIAQINLGTRSYQNVVLCTVDTNSINNGNYTSDKYFMTKVYFQPEYGVVAFHDIKSNSLFYLE